MNDDDLCRTEVVCGKCFTHDKDELVQQLHASVSQCHFMLTSNYFLSLIMKEKSLKESFPLTASFVDPAKIRPGAAIRPRQVSRDAALQANASQRMRLKSNPVLTLVQSSDKTRSSRCLTRIRRKSRIESEMTASRGNGGESQGSGDSKSLKSKAQVEPQT